MKGYFNSVGFERWNKIYGTTDEISSVSPTQFWMLTGTACSRLHAATVSGNSTWEIIPVLAFCLECCDAVVLASLRKSVPTHAGDWAGKTSRHASSSLGHQE